MRKHYACIISFLISFIVFIPVANASGPPKVILKFSPQHLIRNGLWISGEFFNSDFRISHQLSLEGVYAEPYNRNGKEKMSGYTAEYMLRYFPNKMKRFVEPHEVTKGLYGAFFCQAGSYTQSETTTTTGSITYKSEMKAVTFYPGFVLGFEQRIRDGLFIDIYAGAGMHKVSTDISTNRSTNPDTRYFGIFSGGVLPKVGLSIGIGL